MKDLALALIEDGLLTQKDYDRLKKDSYTSGVPVSKILEKSGLIEEEAYAQAKAKFYNVPYIDISSVAASPEALAKLPESVATYYQALPYEYDAKNKILLVAMADPLDLSAITFLEAKSASKIKPSLTLISELAEEIPKRYAQSLSAEVSQVLKENKDSSLGKKIVDVRRIGDVIKEAPIAKIIATILEFAVKSRASDIHIEALEDHTRVRYRIDGILKEKLVLPKKTHDALVSRVKILSDLKIDERRVPQDGRFTFRTDDQEVDLRVSTLPTVDGEKVVMRLLRKSSNVPTLSDLGLRAGALKSLEESVRVPHGIILITGPTGSGKTTTLYSLLHILNTSKVNIVTLEDPVEYQMDGINQVQINIKAGLTFATGLRSFLRQDPNIIMVGEIRDNETADLAIQASLTGHLVFSTLHTNSSSGALPRLLDMQAEPFLLASSITSVVAQRVVRKICENCKEEYTPLPEEIEELKKVLGPLYDSYIESKGITNLKLYRGRKCEKCGDTGYSGRVGIFEALTVSEKVGKLILERAPASSIEKAAVENGMILMQQDGYLKVLDGMTTLEEVMRVAHT